MIGDNFKSFMNNSLKDADAELCLLSDAYLKSSNCEEEWTNADAAGKPFLPLRVEDVNPGGLLAARVYMNLFDKSDSNKLRGELLSWIEGKLNGKPRPTDEPPFPNAKVSAPAPGEPPFPGNAVLPNFPRRNQYFTGREQTLDDIANGLAQAKTVMIWGAGGFGKTQTAIEYAYRHMSEYSHIRLINAASEFELQNDIREFAGTVGLPPEAAADFSVVRNYLARWFAENSRFLMIYDNAEGVSALRDFIPQGQSGGHTLINTRDKNQRVPGAKKLPAEKFSEEEAVSFLQTRLDGNISGGGARELSKELDGLPLALEQAAAYMSEQNMPAEKYLKLFRAYKLKMLKTMPETADYPYTVLTSWNISFEQVEKNENAAGLLKVCAYFAPEDIPLETLTAGREALPPPLCAALSPDNEPERYEIIGELTRYSLLSLRHDEENRAFLSMHRLIQEVLRDRLAGDKRWLDAALEIVRGVFGYEFGDMRSMDDFKLNLPHVLEIAGQAEAAFGDNDDALEATAWLYNTGLAITVITIWLRSGI
jgi:hypothetical protein